MREITVRFANISKRYRLGLTRTSLPSFLSQEIRKLGNGARREVTEDQYLWALRDVSFDLERGQSLALIGPNGAGKSTILKLLAGITHPNNGQIEVDGKLSALIELGAGFHPDLTGRENIYLNGIILGLSRREIDNRFDEIVDFSELERFIDTPVKRYSSGMVVRLGFAVAACIEPDILLVDEVLAVGDASFQQKCMNRIRSMLDKGTSIIFVSHNLYLVQAVCDLALYIDKGQTVARGDTADIIKVYERALHEKRAQKYKIDQRPEGGDGSLDIEITNIEIWDKDGPYKDAIISSQPVQIRIHYNSYKDVGKVNVSVFIVRADGLICCMSRTRLDDFQLSIDRGKGVISLQLEPIQLITGTYFAEAWFLNASDSMVISPLSGRSDWFSVEGSALSYATDSGVFEPNSRWAHFVAGERSINEVSELS